MKYLVVILAMLLAFSSKAQQRYPTGFPTQFNTGWNKWGYAMSDSGLVIANRDTTWLPKFSGTVVFRPANKQFYYFDSTVLRWYPFGINIDTTSLSLRINLKLNISDTVGTWLGQSSRLVDTMYRVNDSTIGYTIKGSPYTFQILGRTSGGGGGGSGTVTSVALSMPSAFTVTGSPIATNGTFSVSGAGTTAQYIRGNGTLATTDTGMIPNFYLKVRGLLSGTSPITFNQTTGLIGINNANTSGTKGAASFTGAFSDNGSGLIDLLDMVSSGSCTNCAVTFDAKGRATAYSSGTGPTGVSVDTIFRVPGVDSIYFTINSVQYAIKDSSGAGGGGTVMSVSGTTNRITVTSPTTTPVVDIAATYAGQTSITTLGTVATGTWNGTAIGPTFGGTGQTSVTTGDLLYGSASNTWSKLADVATGNALISGGIGTAMAWGKIGLTTHVSGILPVANGGTGTATPGLVEGDNVTITGTWPNQTINSTGSGGGQTLVSDLNHLSQIKIYSPAQGVSSSNNVANYTASSVDSAFYKFSLTRAGTAGTEYGGWLTSNLTGDSVLITTPFWIIFGDSQAEGHPGLHGRLHPLVGGTAQNIFQPSYPDSIGQLSYHLRSLTNMRWYNHGIGGETTVAMRVRFTRDVLGEVSNANDSRGTMTLSRRPQGVVIIGGINDVFSGTITTQQTKDNLEWMASMCQQYGIRCVILNMPGDAFSGQTELRKIADINIWLKNGALDQYGSYVVDYNSWWNDPAYGYDNIHHTSLIVDDIHPSKVGYDSLANYVFRQAKLPVLTQAVICNKLDPSGFTGYSRPTGITINSIAYAVPSDSATLDITSYVPDSVWVKITASTSVTGTSYTGISNWLWYVDNNVPDSSYYTRRTLYSGSQKSIADMASLNITARDYSGTISPFRVNYANGTPAIYTSITGSASVVINGSTTLNNSPLTVLGSISTNNSIFSSGVFSYFGNFEVGFVGSASGFGFGIGRTAANAVAIDATNGFSNSDGIVMRYYGGATNNTGVSGNSNSVHIAYNYDNFTGTNDTVNLLTIDPVINNALTSGVRNAVIGVNFKPTITSQGGLKLYGFRNTVGTNLLNQTVGWRTVIGDNNMKASSVLELSRPKQGFLPPRMTTAQRDSIGYISSISIVGGSYTVAPGIAITGGTGNGALANCYIVSGTAIASDVLNHGIGYKPSSAVTVTLSGGTGSGGAATAVINGPDTGLIIYNTTIDSLQYYNGAVWVNVGGGGGGSATTIYNGDGTLLADRSVSSGGFTLRFAGANNSDTLVSIINSGTTSTGLYASGTFLGVNVVSSGGTGLSVFGSTRGAIITGDTDEGLLVKSNAVRGARIQTVPSSTNTVVEILQLERGVSGSPGASGIGQYISFLNKTSTNASNECNTIISKFTDATTATRTSQFSITGVNSGSTVTLMTLDGNGNATFGTTNSIVGTATNNNAVTGNIGEEVNSTVSTYTNYTTTATYQNLTSITLTAGDWDLSAFFTYSANSSTITAASNAIFAISTTTASASGATEGLNINYVPQAALLGTSKFSDAIPSYRVSLSGTTTYYLNTQASFTVGNPQFVGSLRARRMR